MPTEVIRKGIIELGIRLTTDKLEAPDVSAAKKAAMSLQDEFDKVSLAAEGAGQAIGKASDTSAKSVTEQAKGVKSVADELRNYNEESAQLVDANLRAADAFKQAGDGAFVLARGIALVSASGDEDLRKTLETIAAFQGGFDVFRGGTDLIRGAVEAQRALTAATASSAAAEATRTAAVAATGTAATAATPALTAMNVAMGPVAIAALGITGALTTGVALWRQWGDAGVDASTRASNAAQVALAQLKRAQSEARLLRDQARLVRGFQTPEAQIESINDDLNRIGKIESADSLSDRFLLDLRERHNLEKTQRRFGSVYRGPFADPDRIDLADEIDADLEAVNIRIKASRPNVVASLRNEAEEARERQRLLVERAGVQRGVLTDRRTDIDRGIADEERDIDLAKAAIRTAEAQRRQRDLDFLGKGEDAQRLRRRAEDEDRLADLKPEELRTLQSLSGTFTRQIADERLFRAGKIDARPETVQDLGAEAQAEVADSEAKIENLREQRLNLEREMAEINTVLERQLGDMKDRIQSLEGRAGALEEEVGNFSQPGGVQP